MANPELVAQIQLQKSKGVTVDVIKTNLIQDGWSEEDVNGALALTGMPVGPAIQFKSNYAPRLYQRKEPFTVMLAWMIVFVLLCVVVGEFTYWYESRVLADAASAFKHSITTEATSTVNFMPTIKSGPAFPTKFGTQGVSTNSSSRSGQPASVGGSSSAPSPSSAALPNNPVAPTTPTPATQAPTPTQPVSVVTPAPAPVITLCMDNPTISSGGTVAFSWNATNVASCSASGGWSGTQSASGSQTFSSIKSNTTYALQCTGTNGANISQAQTVTVQ